MACFRQFYDFLGLWFSLKVALFLVEFLNILMNYFKHVLLVFRTHTYMQKFVIV